MLRVAKLATASENLLQLLRRYNLQLRVGTFAWIFLGSPSAKMGYMSKAVPLHVLVSNLNDKFGA